MKPNAPHPAAAKGFANAADSYVKGRPDFPPEVMNWLRNSLHISEQITVLDLAAGTGKFTSRLVDTGAHVIAVEPVQQMRDKLIKALPQVESYEGTATAIPLPDASVDVVTCAQSFHWFANAAALAEIYRVLKPGGKLGLIWNWNDERINWIAHLARIINRFEGDAPRYYTGAWRQAFPFPGFGPLEETRFTFRHTDTLENVIFNRVHSTSFIAAMPPAEREKLDEELHALIEREEELRGKETITVPYETIAFHTVKTEK